jgi:hypothetical protein
VTPSAIHREEQSRGALQGAHARQRRKDHHQLDAIQEIRWDGMKTSAIIFVKGGSILVKETPAEITAG